MRLLKQTSKPKYTMWAVAPMYMEAMSGGNRMLLTLAARVCRNLRQQWLCLCIFIERDVYLSLFTLSLSSGMQCLSPSLSCSLSCWVWSYIRFLSLAFSRASCAFFLSMIRFLLLIPFSLFLRLFPLFLLPLAHSLLVLLIHTLLLRIYESRQHYKPPWIYLIRVQMRMVFVGCSVS